MKSTIISMFIVLGLMISVPMIIMGDNDMAEAFGFGGNTKTKNLRAKLPQNIAPVVTNEKVEIYKWRDQFGRMQFSTTPPPNGQAELMELSPDKNVIDAVKIPQKEEVAEAESDTSNMPNPYSVTGMKDMMKQANKLKEVMNSQQAEQQQALDGILKRR